MKKECSYQYPGYGDFEFKDEDFINSVKEDVFNNTTPEKFFDENKNYIFQYAGISEKKDFVTFCNDLKNSCNHPSSLCLQPSTITIFLVAAPSMRSMYTPLLLTCMVVCPLPLASHILRPVMS